jgi:hypothetical protein
MRKADAMRESRRGSLRRVAEMGVIFRNLL